MVETPKIRWLHFTDFHMGIDDADWFGPNVYENLIKDLKKQYEQAGPWDFVLFTGDLVQRGEEALYDEFETQFLDKLWEFFGTLNCNPQLLVVPGNHDLKWQHEEVPAVAMMEKWHQEPSVRKDFWGSDKQGYVGVVNTAFTEFNSWWTPRLKYFPKDHFKAGKLPGDFSYTVEKGGFKLGIVGLNSAFLQLTDSTNYTGEKVYKGRLELHHHQCKGACGNNYVSWLKNNHANILMTHHPADWLHETAQNRMQSEFMDHFALHLCGHNHQTELHQELRGGAESRYLQWTGRSLFGLEKCAGGTIEREHGYAAGWIGPKTARKAEMQFLPRSRFGAKGTSWSIRVDQHGVQDDGPWSRIFSHNMFQAWQPNDSKENKGDASPPPKGLFIQWIITRLTGALSSNQQFCQLIAKSTNSGSEEPKKLALFLVGMGLSDFWVAMGLEPLGTSQDFITPIKEIVFLLAQAACKPELVDRVKEQLEKRESNNYFKLNTRYAEMGELVLSAALKRNVSLVRGDETMDLKCEHLTNLCDASVSEPGIDSQRTYMDAKNHLMAKFKLNTKPGASEKAKNKDLEDILEDRAKRRKHVSVAHYGTEPLSIPYIVDFILPFNTSEKDNVTTNGDACLYDLICDILDELKKK